MKTPVAVFILSLMPLCGFSATEAVCNRLFQTDQDILAPVQERLGRTLEVGKLENQTKTWIYISDARTLERIGFIDFQYHDHILDIGLIKVEKFKKSGVGEALIKLALKTHPDVQVIQAKVLIEDNKVALEDALKRGLSMIEAIKQTPSFKIHAKLGFTDIITESLLSEKDGYGFAVRRPALNSFAVFHHNR